MATEVSRSANHSIHSATLADVLERVLDKGLVIAGDIKIKLVDIELPTIQIRLVVASVEKAREMGMDWWTSNSDFQSKPMSREQQSELNALRVYPESYAALFLTYLNGIGIRASSGASRLMIPRMALILIQASLDSVRRS